MGIFGGIFLGYGGDIFCGGAFWQYFGRLGSDWKWIFQDILFYFGAFGLIAVAIGSGWDKAS